jgi:hypothetical protein
MSDDVQVDRKLTSWIRDAGPPEMGEAILTTRRLELRVAGDQPIVIELDDVLAIAHERRLLRRDRIRITTTDGEYLINDGWQAWSPLLLARVQARGTRRVEGAPPSAD